MASPGQPRKTAAGRAAAPARSTTAARRTGPGPKPPQQTTLNRVGAALAGIVLSATSVAVANWDARSRQHQEPSSAVALSTSLAAKLAALPVAPEHRDGYDRGLFNHWTDADGDGCNTRSEVLTAESLVPVTKNARCTVVTGRWYSVYDGEEPTRGSDVDVDHVVALAEAWDSGAWQWDAARREAYANDLDHEFALIAVSDHSNQSKSDQDPAEWMPPRAPDWCRYLNAWVDVKTIWQLSIDAAEERAIEANGSDC